jgi:hypothetical protein
MVLNIKTLGFLLTIFTSFSVFAHIKDDFFTVSKVRIRETNNLVLTDERLDRLYLKSDFRVKDLPKNGNPPTVDNAGKVISTAKDLVALGEDVYKLVIKGKPHNTTSYAPISVVPKENGEAVDIFTTEYWSEPVSRTFEAVYENLYGVDVVTFRYSVIFSYGGSYNGKGKYLTAVQIIPEQVRTLFGFDFTSTMKLGGIQNHGSRENPIAGATLLLESTISSVMVAHTDVYTFHVNGMGGFVSYQR